MNVPASGPQNNVLLLPKELDEKVARMHFSALVAELIVLRVEVFTTGTSPKADYRATVLYEVVLRLVFTEFLVQVTRGTHLHLRLFLPSTHIRRAHCDATPGTNHPDRTEDFGSFPESAY